MCITFIACCQTQSSYIYHTHLNSRFCRLSDERNAFCLNGLEIDLDELDALEQRVKAKKRLHDASASNNTSSSKPPADDVDEVDELDEYLKELRLRESREQEQQLQRQQTNYNNNISYSDSIQSTNFAILLYWFLAILNLANATYYCKHCELDNA